MGRGLKVRKIVTMGAALLASAMVQGALPAGAGAPTEPPIVSSDYFVVTSYDHVWAGGVTDEFGRLWAKKCKRGEQQVSFTKTINIPGPPSSVTVNLSPGGHVKKLLLKLDNQVLVKGKGPFKDFSGDLSPADAGRFTDGEHVLKIVAVKKRTSKGIAPNCGVTLYLRGVFQADMAVGVKESLFWSRPYAIATGTFTVTNNGPSSSPGGTFTVTHSDASRTILQSLSPPFTEDNCQISNVGITCRYGTALSPNNEVYFPVGATATFSVRWDWFTLNEEGGEDPSYRTDGSYSTWRIAGNGTDPDPSNNEDDIQIYVCGGVSSPPPECEGADIEGDEDDDPDA